LRSKDEKLHYARGRYPTGEKKEANKQVIRTGANKNLSKIVSHRFSGIIVIIAIAVSLILALLEKIGFFLRKRCQSSVISYNYVSQ